MSNRDDYMTTDQQVHIYDATKALQKRLQKLLGEKFPKEKAEFHAIALAETWEALQRMATYIEDFSSEIRSDFGLHSDDPDFFSESTAELIHLEEHIAQIRRAIKDIERISKRP